MHIFKKHETNNDYADALLIAEKLEWFMSQPETREKIAQEHRFRATSTQIQSILLPFCETLGFLSEKKGLFDGYKVARLRPDYYARLTQSGIILEVERGKTVVNNMDLLDIWKCHICDHASYLILVVPNIRESGNGRKTNVYERVISRLEPFFTVEHYVNVDACFVIGY